MRQRLPVPATGQTATRTAIATTAAKVEQTTNTTTESAITTRGEGKSATATFKKSATIINLGSTEAKWNPAITMLSIMTDTDGLP